MSSALRSCVAGFVVIVADLRHLRCDFAPVILQFSLLVVMVYLASAARGGPATIGVRPLL